MKVTPERRNLEVKRPPPHPGLDLVRATEAAAVAAGRWMGLGSRDDADHAAQVAMADALSLLPMRGQVVIGEEGRVGGRSPLDSGAMVGNGEGPELDVEANAIDGAKLVAQGLSGAIAVAAVAPRGAMWAPVPAVYMDKIVVDRTVARALVPECLDAPAAWTLALVARMKEKAVRDLVVFVLDRPRHQHLIEEIRTAGARVFLRSEGDIGGALLAADPRTEVDLLMGIGGIAEGLIGACAVKALGGAMLGRVAPQREEERIACESVGVDINQVLTCDELVASDNIFFTATGITDDVLLDGVHFHGDIVETHSLVLRSETGTRRIIHTEHILR